MSNYRWTAVLIVFVVALGVGWHNWQARADKQRFALIQSDKSSFTSNGSFMADAVLHSPMGLTVKSALGTTCLAYSVRVEYHQEFKKRADDPGSGPEIRVSQIFKAQEHAPDMIVQFEGGDALLSLVSVKRFWGEKPVRSAGCPEFVPEEKRPPHTTAKYWFQSYEETFLEGGKVFVIGAMDDSKKFLMPHAQFGSLVIFQGTRERFLQLISARARQQTSYAYWWLGIGFVLVLLVLAVERIYD